MNPIFNVQIPSWVPLIGGSSSSMNRPTASAYLQYNISGHNLTLTQPPDFYQQLTKLGVGVPGIVNFKFTAPE